MSQGDRRTFLSETGTGIAGAAAIMSSLLSSRAQGANERVHVGLIGCGGRGIQVARTIGSQNDAVIRYVCDPDSTRAAKAKDHTRADQAVADLRRILGVRATYLVALP